MEKHNPSKQNILTRLRKAGAQPLPTHPASYSQWYSDSESERVERFQLKLTANHAEVINVKSETIQAALEKIYQSHNINRLAVGTNGAFHQSIIQAGKQREVQLFDTEIEHVKSELFDEVDAGVTHSLAGIADTGTLVLWPSVNEPRTLSLVPPIHIALIKQSTIVSNFTQLMQTQQWHRNMPTNSLLISGPSKTADIQQTLAYGAHGPSKLIIVLIENR
jgi:L-lactate dehydrogenase complex protein LldG